MAMKRHGRILSILFAFLLTGWSLTKFNQSELRVSEILGGFDQKYNPWAQDGPIAPITVEDATTTASNHSVFPNLDNSNLKDGNATLLDEATKFINAIMNAEDQSFERLQCPRPNGTRYEYLQKKTGSKMEEGQKPRYFFALNLHRARDILPRLLGSVVETMHYLGPENCVLSIIEGRSLDGTYEVLKLLRKEVESIGSTMILNTSNINPTEKGGKKDGIRIQSLAALRNLALEPLTAQQSLFSPETVVIFLNDVAICMEDILELVHQRKYQDADMMCAMDYIYLGKNQTLYNPTFYDIWVARQINGDSFFQIPNSGSWGKAHDLFWNHATSQARYEARRPFQVFSCWNGATVFSATPLWEKGIRFRGPNLEKECFQGEPQLFAKDLWYAGSGKIGVVPSISLEYWDENATRLKKMYGWTSEWVLDGIQEDPRNKIDWNGPPEKVKCMPEIGSWKNQTFIPWNESMPL